MWIKIYPDGNPFGNNLELKENKLGPRGSFSGKYVKKESKILRYSFSFSSS